MSGETIEPLLDSKSLARVTDHSHTHGMVALSPDEGTARAFGFGTGRRDGGRRLSLGGEARERHGSADDDRCCGGRLCDSVSCEGAVPVDWLQSSIALETGLLILCPNNSGCWCSSPSGLHRCTGRCRFGQSDFAGYKVIAAPNLRLVDDAIVKRLTEYVAGGEILVLNYRAGTQYMDASMRRVLAPGAFTENAGVTTDAKLDLVDYTGLGDQFEISFAGTEGGFHPRTILETLTLHGAKTIASFRGGRMTGRAAITRNRHGQGWIFYVGNDCADDPVSRSAGARGCCDGKTCAGIHPAHRQAAGIKIRSRVVTNA